MKTLTEEINDIKNASISKAAKKRALVSLGLMPYEVRMLMATMPEGPSRSRVEWTFGVEIECFVPHGAVGDAAAQTGLAYQYEGYNHNDGHSHFKFVRDGSLGGMPDPIECVSPVLKGADGKRKLKNVCKTLNMAGARVNRSCGLHVHIGAAGLTEEQYCSVFSNYAFLQSVISRFMAPSRRDNGYAQPIDRFRHNLLACRTVSDVQRELWSRYFAVNPKSWDRHRTIEFRQHGGTTNYEKIAAWVSFCGKLVEWSKTNRLEVPVTCIENVPFLTAKEKAYFRARTDSFDTFEN